MSRTTPGPLLLLATLVGFGAVAQADEGWFSFRGVEEADFSHDGSLLVIRTTAGRVSTWDVGTGEQTEPICETGRYVMSDDGRRLLGHCRDGSVVLSDLAAGETTAVKVALTWANAEFSPDGRSVVIIDGDQRVVVADTRTGRISAVLASGRSEDEDTHWSPGPRFTADGSGCFVMMEDGRLRRFETTNWRAVGVSMLHPKRGYDLSFAISADGRFAATRDSDGDCGLKGHVQVWDVLRAAPIGEPMPVSRSGPWFLPGGKRMVISGWGTASLFDMPSLSRPFALPQHSDEGTRLVPSRGGQWLLTWGDGALEVLESHGGKKVGALKAALVRQAVASPATNRCVLLIDDTALNSQPVRRLRMVLASLPDLEILGTVAFEAKDQVSGAMRFSADGRRVLLRAGGYAEGRLRVFETRGLEEIGVTRAD